MQVTMISYDLERLFGRFEIDGKMTDVTFDGGSLLQCYPATTKAVEDKILTMIRRTK